MSLGQSAPDAFAANRVAISAIRGAGVTSHSILTEEPPGLLFGSSGRSADLFTGILDPYGVIEIQRRRYCNPDGSVPQTSASPVPLVEVSPSH